MDSDFINMVFPILRAALRRSLATEPCLRAFPWGMVLFCKPQNTWGPEEPFSGKAIVFGTPPSSMLPSLGLCLEADLPSLEGADECLPAEGTVPFTESSGFVNYVEHPLNSGVWFRKRPFTRFDYADEWNNLGFGRICTDKGPWAVSGGLRNDKAVELASLCRNDVTTETTYCGSYLTLFDTMQSSVLWCARPVGPVDSTEWTVIEKFLADWRSDDMPCLPYLYQTPAGCRCIVTMRLDCDEDIASANDVFKWYADAGLPFSLAVKTSLPFREADITLLEHVRESGGSLLSHSHAHQKNWGDTPEQALADAEMSRQWFMQTWPEIPPPDFAVSPFHTNPPYAVQSLVQAGFIGFVSGIIHNDPEYLLGRAGVVPLSEPSMLSISQQSMLHGDCYKRQGETIDVHLSAFAAQHLARGIFGYLDHPFSERYQYDWNDSAQRLQAHKELVKAIQAYPDVWFWSQERCFALVQTLASVQLDVLPDGSVRAVYTPDDGFELEYRYKKKDCRLQTGAPGN